MPEKIKQEIIRSRYSITASSYDELYLVEQYQKYASSIWQVKPEGKILDDGCGTALLLEYIAYHGLLTNINYYICLDITREMLKIALRRERNLNLTHIIDNIEADAEHLPLRPHSVNKVYSYTVFDLLANPARGIEEAKRVSKGDIIYSILRVIPRLKIKIAGKYLAETAKDIIFIIKNNTKQGSRQLLAPSKLKSEEKVA